MTRVERFAWVVLLTMILGCGVAVASDTSNPEVRAPENYSYTFWMNTIDGRKIPCVQTYYGLSCDWSKR